MLPTVVCLSSTRPQTERIVEHLQEADVPVSAISVMVLPNDPDSEPEPIKSLSFAHGKQAGTTAANAATGAAAGAAAGTATMSIVGLTPLLMIAPLVVAGGAALGAATGAVGSELADYGVPQSRRDYFQQQLIDGQLLVAVRTEDETALGRARSVFEQAGGQDIDVFRLTKKLA